MQEGDLNLASQATIIRLAYRADTFRYAGGV